MKSPLATFVNTVTDRIQVHFSGAHLCDWTTLPSTVGQPGASTGSSLVPCNQ